MLKLISGLFLVSSLAFQISYASSLGATGPAMSMITNSYLERGDLEGLRRFMNTISSPGFSSVSGGEVVDHKVYVSHTQEPKDDYFEYALKPIIYHDQIDLNVSDIINASSKINNPENVFTIDLSGFNFSSEDSDKIYEFFLKNPLCNLRSIDLRNSRETSSLIDKIFGTERENKKFYSLTRMSAKNSTLNVADVEKIFNHLSSYHQLIRDGQQISSRHEKIVIPFYLEMDRPSGDVPENLGRYLQGGRLSENSIRASYRVDEATDAPLMVGVIFD